MGNLFSAKRHSVFKSAVLAFIGNKIVDKSEIINLANLFKNLDKDNNGTLDAQEINEGLKLFFGQSV